MWSEPLIITLSGEYDLARREELRKQLQAAFDAESVIFDLTQVTYIDSSSLETFVQIRRSRRARSLALCHFVVKDGLVRKVFQVTGFDQLWPIDDSVDEAISCP